VNRRWNEVKTDLLSPKERAGEERARAFEAAVAAAQADLDAMDGPPAPVPPPPDVAALVAAELARHRQAEAAAIEAAEADRFACPTGACAYCALGAVRTPNAEGGFSPAWHTDPHGHRCGICDGELFSRIADTDADRRVRVMLRLLGLEHSQPLRALGNPEAFAGIPVWHYEHRGAPPVWTEADRFAHVDRDRLRQQWDVVARPRREVPPEVIAEHSQPCPRCGAAAWCYGEVGHAGVDYVCRHCGHVRGEPLPPGLPDTARRPWRTEADVAAARLLGVPLAAPIYDHQHDPVLGLAARAGFTWAAEARGDRHRRATSEPWAHLDVAKMRRRLDQVPVG
jgi:hypothetical protein